MLFGVIGHSINEKISILLVARSQLVGYYFIILVREIMQWNKKFESDGIKSES